MNGHVGAGIIILGVAAFLFIMGVKGTQHQLFPQIFGAPSQNTSDQTPNTVPPGTSGTGAGTPGGCPPGFHSVVIGGRFPGCAPNTI